MSYESQNMEEMKENYEGACKTKSDQTRLLKRIDEAVGEKK